MIDAYLIKIISINSFNIHKVKRIKEQSGLKVPCSINKYSKNELLLAINIIEENLSIKR